MAPRLQILSNVVERLRNVTEPVDGHLYGVIFNDTLTVLTFTIHVSDEDEDEIIDTVLQPNMPVGIDLCGILHVGQCSEIIPVAFKDIDITDNPLLLRCTLDGSKLEPYFYIHQKLEPASNVQIITEDDLLHQFTYIRLQGSLSLVIQNLNVMDTLQETKKNIASGNVGVYFPSSNVYLFDNDDNLKDIPVKELLSGPRTYEGSGNNKGNTKHLTKFVDVLHASMFMKISGNKLSEKGAKYAPVLQHVKRTFDSLECHLSIDTLSLVCQSISSSDLYAILVESICRNIKLMESFFEDHLRQTDMPTKLPQPVHFKPQICGHLLTVIYPANCSDDDTLEYRKTLHKVLALDMTRPCFRRGNMAKFYTDVQKEEILVNPHESLLGNNGTDTKLSIVDGLYSYHHYMQDGFDDNGWGCAYRSLQTIVSWYRLQGYTDVPIPSHRTIQKCLVDIGDKPSNFIGSKQWIGSTEVGFVLETLLGVSIKVLCASSGTEMSTLITDLQYHFETQGTPVMIGGGVLAHTILGVSYNESSGEIKYLILDPHYTGSDHLPTILNKGWCGWKTKDFWKKDAFYNMCLPQRPVCI